MPNHVQEHFIRQTYSRLFPLISADELMDRVLSRPPSEQSTRILIRELRKSPKRFGDRRVAAFAEHARGIEHEELPQVGVVDLYQPEEVDAFLSFHPECGPAHLRDRLREERRPFHRRPAWLLDQPWFEAVADQHFRNDVCGWIDELSLHELADIADRHPSWVARERVRKAVLESPQIPRPEGLPAWLDDTLFERAKAAGSSEELNLLLPRFRDHKHYRSHFIELVQTRLVAHPDRYGAGMMADLLESASAWEKHGPELTHALLTAGHGTTLQLVMLRCCERWQTKGTLSDAKLLVKLHLALAQGTLRWAAHRLDAGDHALVERALMCVAVLDPPRAFTRDLHRFGKLPGLNQAETEWVKHLYGMAKAGAKREPTIDAAWDALAELLGGGEA